MLQWGVSFYCRIRWTFYALHWLTCLADVEELSWFLRGSTNVQELRDKKIHIWDGNSADRDYDAGPVYGFQWRHFGAEYTDCHDDYMGQGVDQVTRIINLIKTDPTSRRMVLSAWCPSHQDQMCLPPCHVMYQFYVEEDGCVSCMMTQRSADVFLGLSFNIASTALLTTLVAHQTGRAPGHLWINIGDAHVYEEHVYACQKQNRSSIKNQICNVIKRCTPFRRRNHNFSG